MSKFKSITTLLFLCGLVKSQNCNTRGEFCNDDKLCCGGCCFENICIDTYQDCKELKTPCDGAYCPADALCKVYKPPCDGCEWEKKCVSVDSTDAIQFQFDPRVDKISSANRTKITFLSIAAICFFLIFF